VEDINRVESGTTPSVILNNSSGVLEITGKSTPEDAAGFFEPILDWLSKYPKDYFPTLSIRFKLDYYNTATSLMILKIMQALDDLNAKGNKTKIEWYCEEYDEGLQESGEMYKETISHSPFDIITYEEE